MIRIIFPKENIFKLKFLKFIIIRSFKPKYQSEFEQNYELTCNTKFKKINGIKYNAYKNYGLNNRKKNKINNEYDYDEEFKRFLIGK